MFPIQNTRLILTFIDLVKIPSPSWEEEGVISYIEKCAAECGYKSFRVKCGKSHNLLVRVPGSPKKKPVLCAAHTDTVTPCINVRPVITSDKISSDGTTILGGDDKAAVAVFIEAMRILSSSANDNPPIEFLFTCAEEIGLCGMKGMDFSLLKSKRAFVFDCSGTIGTAIVRAPSQIVIHAEVIGRAAHAGIEPEKGISAIVAMSDIITKLPHGRIDKETTANVGIVRGGLATNIVAERASFDMEMRSLNPAKLRTLEKKTISQIKDRAKKLNVKVKIDSHLEYQAFSLAKDESILEIVERSAKMIGKKALFTSSGGGSDTNVLNAKGLRAVNLSIGMTNVHSTREYILKKDIIDGCELLLSILANA